MPPQSSKSKSINSLSSQQITLQKKQTLSHLHSKSLRLESHQISTTLRDSKAAYVYEARKSYELKKRESLISMLGYDRGEVERRRPQTATNSIRSQHDASSSAFLNNGNGSSSNRPQSSSGRLNNDPNTDKRLASKAYRVRAIVNTSSSLDNDGYKDARSRIQTPFNHNESTSRPQSSSGLRMNKQSTHHNNIVQARPSSATPRLTSSPSNTLLFNKSKTFPIPHATHINIIQIKPPVPMTSSTFPSEVKITPVNFGAAVCSDWNERLESQGFDTTGGILSGKSVRNYSRSKASLFKVTDGSKFDKSKSNDSNANVATHLHRLRMGFLSGIPPCFDGRDRPVSPYIATSSNRMNTSKSLSPWNSKRTVPTMRAVPTMRNSGGKPIWRLGNKSLSGVS